jgi:hypothetical protein
VLRQAPNADRQLSRELQSILFPFNSACGREARDRTPPAGRGLEYFLRSGPNRGKGFCQPNITYGAPGSSSWATALMNVEEGMYTNDSGQWWFRQFPQQISPTLSAYMICDDEPSAILFAGFHKGPEYRVEFRSAGLAPNDDSHLV